MLLYTYTSLNDAGKLLTAHLSPRSGTHGICELSLYLKQPACISKQVHSHWTHSCIRLTPWVKVSCSGCIHTLSDVFASIAICFSLLVAVNFTTLSLRQPSLLQPSSSLTWGGWARATFSLIRPAHPQPPSRQRGVLLYFLRHNQIYHFPTSTTPLRHVRAFSCSRCRPCQRPT